MFSERDVARNPSGCSLQFLERMGWLRPVEMVGWEPRLVASAPPANVQLTAEHIRLLDDAVAYAFGEEERGKPGSRIKLLTTPRCGCPDHITLPMGLAPGLAKWPTNDLRIWVGGGLPGVTRERHLAAWEWAITISQSMCGLRLNLVMTKSQCNIWAGSDWIDGPNGTLAWSYLINPSLPPNWQCEQRYDTGDSWPDEKLRVCVLHELWHALGRQHTSNQRSFMRPYLLLPFPGPDEEDVREAQARYGPPAARPVPPPEPNPPAPEPEKRYFTIITPGGERYRLAVEPA